MVKYYNGEMYRIPQAFEDEVRADERAKVVGMCAKVIANQLPAICTTSCPIKCEWGTTENCANYWEKYLLEQLKERSNDERI